MNFQESQEFETMRIELGALVHRKATLIKIIEGLAYFIYIQKTASILNHFKQIESLQYYPDFLEKFRQIEKIISKRLA